MSRLGFALTWLGHSAFHIRGEPDGPVVLFDPWLDNPKAPSNAADLAAGADLIVITHGHGDHIDGTAELAKQSGATVLTSVECAMDIGAEGVPEAQIVGFNKGGSATAAGVTVTLVQAFHSSSRESPGGRARSVGDPCGAVVELPNGVVIYNTGDTCVFGDMALLAELYRPAVLMLPIGDFYTMGPRQAAKACELVNPKWIVPQHYGTFPALTGTPEALRKHLPVGMKDRVIAPMPGETVR